MNIDQQAAPQARPTPEEDYEVIAQVFPEGIPQGYIQEVAKRGYKLHSIQAVAFVTDKAHFSLVAIFKR